MKKCVDCKYCHEMKQDGKTTYVCYIKLYEKECEKEKDTPPSKD